MDGFLPENMKVLIQWLAQVEYVPKESQGDQNTQFQKIVIIRKISSLHFILKFLERNYVNDKFQHGL